MVSTPSRCRATRRYENSLPYLVYMAGCRPLSTEEKRALLRAVRKFSPRDRALVVTQLLTGFRISEVLSLSVGSVFRNGVLVSKIGVAPRNLKGGYGATRWIPILPTLAQALESHLAHLRRRYELTPELPLFLSRQDNADGAARSIGREVARQVVHRALAAAGIQNDGRLGTHTLRKTFARVVYANAGNDLIVLKKALNHSSVAISERYLEVAEDEVLRAISKCDRARPRRSAKSIAVPTTPAALPVPTPTRPQPADTPAPTPILAYVPALSQAATPPITPRTVTTAAAAPNAQLDFFTALAAA